MKSKRGNTSYNQMVKIEQVYTDHRVKCVCGHSVFIPAYKSKKICNWCYRTVYNNNSLGQKEKFIAEFKKSKERIKRNENNKSNII